MKLLLTIYLILTQILLYGDNCDDIVEVNYLPLSMTWCMDGSNRIENPYGVLHPEYGCWVCLDNPKWFKFTAYNDAQLEMWLYSDLYTSHPSINNVQVVYWFVFDGCPFNGGSVISAPMTTSNPNGPCWTFQDDIIAEACFWNANWVPSYAQTCYENPLVLGPRHNNYVVFELNEGNEYWVLIQPACSMFDPWDSYGCITVEFSGPNFLDLPNEETEEIILPELKTIFHEKRLVKVYNPRYGVLLFDIVSKKYYTISYQEIIP